MQRYRASSYPYMKKPRTDDLILNSSSFFSPEIYLASRRATVCKSHVYGGPVHQH